MKLRKLSALLLTLCCAVMLGSCKVTETATTTTAVPGKNTIQPAVLTQEESDLLELLVGDLDCCENETKTEGN